MGSAQDVLNHSKTTISHDHSQQRLQLAMLNRKKARNAFQKGFTLIELLITVVILGVLSSVAVPGFIAQKNRADVAAANAQGRSLMSACKVGVSEGENIATTLTNPKTFGSVTWTPSVTQTAGSAPTACSSATTGAPTAEQSFILDTTTGDLSTETEAS